MTETQSGRIRRPVSDYSDSFMLAATSTSFTGAPLGFLPRAARQGLRRRQPISCSSPAAPVHERLFSFAAAPTSLPERVARKAQSELLNYRGGAATAAEKVARRKRDLAVAISRAESALRLLLRIPEDYVVLFLPGGVSTFFPAVPLNLCSSPADEADYIVTGSWSDRAFAAAAEHCQAAVAWTGQPCNFARLPSQTELRLNPRAKFLHLCADEPGQGLQFCDSSLPLTSAVLAADMSSSFCSKPVDVSRFGLLYAGAQGSETPGGLTVAVVRRDLVRKPQPGTPLMLDFAAHLDGAANLCNSPPAAAIYLCALVFEDLLERGGLEAAEKRNRERANVIYEVVDGSGGFYDCPVKDPVERSAMNARFVLARSDLERKFVVEAHRAGMADLGAHGGAIAAEIGAATPMIAGVRLENAERLAAFMKDFQVRHQRAADIEAVPAAA